MKMKNMMMKDPIISMMKNSLLELPTPLSISSLWNMGFLLGMTLMLQIITGVVLSMNYIPHSMMAFESVIHIMRDIDSGWIMRYLHMNGASLFFMLMYTHMSRGIYFNSPTKLPMVWLSGVVILLISMATAFLGYVLPWGQMSFWGSTVITSMVTALPYIGESLALWLWGNFSVSQPTLNSFYSLHFLLPLVLVALALMHLIFLHQAGSSNPTGLVTSVDKIKFFPVFLISDMMPLISVVSALTLVVCLTPNILGDVENFNTASIVSTPTHIQPEWYFLYTYAILRSIPSKLGGVLAMMGAILILSTLVLKENKDMKKFSPRKKITMWTFIALTVILTWVGANPVEQPLINIGQVSTFLYFFIFLEL